MTRLWRAPTRRVGACGRRSGPSCRFVPWRTTARYAERAMAAAFDCFATVQRLMHPTVWAGSRCAPHRRRSGGRSGCIAGPGTCFLSLRKLTTSQRGDSIRACRSVDGRMMRCGIARAGSRRCSTDRSRWTSVESRRDYAVDRAVERLMSAGCVAGEVNAGGDVRVFGLQPTPLWLRTDRAMRRIDIARSSMRGERSVGARSAHESIAVTTVASRRRAR